MSIWGVWEWLTKASSTGFREQLETGSRRKKNWNLYLFPGWKANQVKASICQDRKTKRNSTDWKSNEFCSRYAGLQSLYYNQDKQLQGMCWGWKLKLWKESALAGSVCVAQNSENMPDHSGRARRWKGVTAGSTAVLDARGEIRRAEAGEVRGNRMFREK